MPPESLYETDLVVWTERQAEALRHAGRAGSNLPLDWDNLAEEIDSVGRGERSAIERLVHNIILHLLKVRFSPARRPRRKWVGEIDRARDLLHRKLDMSPSLRLRMPDIVAAELEPARRAAARDVRRYDEVEASAAIDATRFDLSEEQVMDEDFFLPGTVFAREDATQSGRARDRDGA